MTTSLDLDGLQRALSAFSAAQGTGTIVATGTDQASAASATKLFTIVSSSAPGTGVTIAPLYGQMGIVYNDTANVVKVYPLSGMTMKPNASVSVLPGGSVGVIVTDGSSAHVAFNSSSFG